MDEFDVTAAEWEEIAEPVEELGWRIRVAMEGTGLVDRAQPLMAIVGDVEVEGLTGSPSGATAQGFLAEVPPVGAVLSIGYADTGLVATSVEFPGLPNT